MAKSKTITWATFEACVRLAGPWAQLGPDARWHSLDMELPRIRTCCYIAVDQMGEVLYVGRVQRKDRRGLRGRFSLHHRRHAGWDGLWVVPMADTTPSVAMANTEAALISFLSPPENGTAPRLWTGS